MPDLEKEEKKFYFRLTKSYLKPKLDKAGKAQFYAKRNKRIRYFYTTDKETVKYLQKRGEELVETSLVMAETEAHEELVRNKPKHQKHVFITI